MWDSVGKEYPIRVSVETMRTRSEHYWTIPNAPTCLLPSPPPCYATNPTQPNTKSHRLGVLCVVSCGGFNVETGYVMLSILYYFQRGKETPLSQTARRERDRIHMRSIDRTIAFLSCTRQALFILIFWNNVFFTESIVWRQRNVCFFNMFKYAHGRRTCYLYICLVVFAVCTGLSETLMMIASYGL